MLGSIYDGFDKRAALIYGSAVFVLIAAFYKPKSLKKRLGVASITGATAGVTAAAMQLPPLF